MSLINVTNLSFAYEGSYDNIFENVSFSLDTDWRVGFVGRNGRGKTTFLRLLLGKLEYQGSITKSVNVEYFPYEIKDATETTIDIVLRISNDLPIWQVEKELALLKTDKNVLQRPFNTLSQGEQTKVLLAALFLKQNDFLLIDEPTNHLDTAARKTVRDYLKTKKGFILVSHDRNFLDECTDHTIAINKQNIEIISGNFSVWWQEKQNRDNFEISENHKLKSEIARLEAAATKIADWSEKTERSKIGTKIAGLKPDRGAVGAQAARVMKRSKNAENRANNAISEKSALLKNLEETDALKIFPILHHADNLVHIKNLSVFYGKHTVLSNLSFDIKTLDRVSISGKNGSGKSSILKLLLGENISYSGELRLASNLIISYVPQSCDYLKGTLKDFAFENKIDEVLFNTILRKLGFERAQLTKNMEDFSQGQKKKVQIAASLCEKANLYIWDEPLNYIDVFSCMQIEQLILHYRPTLLFVEHDSTFCDKIATKKITV